LSWWCEKRPVNGFEEGETAFMKFMTNRNIENETDLLSPIKHWNRKVSKIPKQN
jgi:hypothetical protein